MPQTSPNPWLHRFAVSTVGVALLTLIAGALVTSKHAGMAFRDWPTSDGRNMLTYPWLADFARDWDKFLEHGHRLSASLTGLWTIGLVVATWRTTRSRVLRFLSAGILLGVISQGVLGGFRVTLDERGLAMLHGLFASIVFSLMGSMVVITSSGWRHASQADADACSQAFELRPWAVSLVVVLLLQYGLGGFIRHRGSGLHEHLGLGLLLPFLTLIVAALSARTRDSWLTNSGFMLLSAVLLQAMLGGVTWIAKFGFTPTGYVATADSIGQVASRTAHMVLGAIVMMAAVSHALKVLRVAAHHKPEPVDLFSKHPVTSGGAA